MSSVHVIISFIPFFRFVRPRERYTYLTMFSFFFSLFVIKVTKHERLRITYKLFFFFSVLRLPMVRNVHFSTSLFFLGVMTVYLLTASL